MSNKSIGLFHSNWAMGPSKVLKSIVDGFKELNVNYSFNTFSDINYFVQNHKFLGNEEFSKHNITNLYLGPNIADLPIYHTVLGNPALYEKTIVACDWLANIYATFIPREKIAVWNCGIELDKFSDSIRTTPEFDFLIYFKNRNVSDLNQVTEFLTNKNYTYTVLNYGHYSEQQFLTLLSKTKYCFVIDNTETQGIAIQEIMACNIPLLVWDTTIWNKLGPDKVFPTTSVPYFDNSCGKKFSSIIELEQTFNDFIDNNKFFNPRQYISSVCNNKIQTQKLLSILNY